ncbi:MAG: KH domain-containing protein [Methanomassiliicoccales archaeon]|nr:KH domain-containing protein [Methanomassiliicoccales archaeon]
MASERKFVAENIRRVLLKEYLMKTVDRAGFGGVDVQRTPMGTRVTLVVERPGIVIGRRGAAIKSLTKAIEDNYHYDNPQIEVQEVENPNLNAEKFKDGYIKYCGESRLLFVGTGFAVAKLKPGVIGVQVEIMQPGARLPAEIDVMGMEAAILANPDLAELLKKQEEVSVIAEHPAEDTPAEDTKKEVAE